MSTRRRLMMQSGGGGDFESKLQFVSAIRNTSLAYIKTKITPNETTIIKCTFIPNWGNFAFGSVDGNDANSLYVHVTGGKPRIYFDKNTWSETKVQALNKYVVTIGGGVLKIEDENGGILWSSSSGVKKKMTKELFIFAVNNNGQIRQDRYFSINELEIWHDDVYYHFLPCYSIQRIIDNKGVLCEKNTVGLADVNNKVFYTSDKVNSNFDYIL